MTILGIFVYRDFSGVDFILDIAQTFFISVFRKCYLLTTLSKEIYRKKIRN